ncbi:MGH1-like glycoside hydrolase domain-containing protein [Pedobacter sp. GR22-6]|uniref:MGH1-like glycoside hydrolase domain-containing protein n=1 Tax=Pedobacter sp. GR22-6 TaxID=3127957 RepID=UPI00307F3F37
MPEEINRLSQSAWKKWGPYVSNRQWGTVREDYSENGDAWQYSSHDMARSKAWRWGEEGIGGISDDKQFLCFAPSFWNGRDPILKEVFFGLTNAEGNHGEDVKELFYYLDSSPTHSYMKMLYKYPQQAYPYEQLLRENRNRSRQEPEYELADTGIFDQNEYFDIFIEYAKSATEDILISITAHNRNQKKAQLSILPTLWFRNRWSWGEHDKDLSISKKDNQAVDIIHKDLGAYSLYTQTPAEWVFTENESNTSRLYQYDDGAKYCKDAFHRYVVQDDKAAVNPANEGSKAAAVYNFEIDAGQSVNLKLRLCKGSKEQPFSDFEQLFNQRKNETDEFYQTLQDKSNSTDERLIHRQAIAGLLWNKQFYNYNVGKWLKGDPAQPAPPAGHTHSRNLNWKHLNNADIISMPDKWEFPWYASWDLAFHCVSLALVDIEFAKEQLQLLTKEWFMHPNGQLPAYEWNFDDTNPPVHAWATWEVYKMDQESNEGKGDIAFLEAVFQKLLINFTWWVNRKDHTGSNIFSGGFLGLDNIGVFDRSMELPTGMHIEQADGTSWMAMYALNMMQISLELSLHNPVYENMATKFFEHFLYIAGAIMNIMGPDDSGLWDNEDEFFYDELSIEGKDSIKLKLRSMVGLIPLFAVEVIKDDTLKKLPNFARRMEWFLKNKPELASLVSRWTEKGQGDKHLLSLLRGHRIKRILYRMLNETEFLSEFGIRSLSKTYSQNPFIFPTEKENIIVSYVPGESDSGMFGGNSNWRGPIWMPVNYLIIQSLLRFHEYYNDDFKVEYPSGTGNYLSLREIAVKLSERLISIFKQNEQGLRPCFGGHDKLQQDPNFKDYLLFNEYFHGDNGKGLGASHQTGWTALIANLIQR